MTGTESIVRKSFTHGTEICNIHSIHCITQRTAFAPGGGVTLLLPKSTYPAAISIVVNTKQRVAYMIILPLRSRSAMERMILFALPVRESTSLTRRWALSIFSLFRPSSSVILSAVGYVVYNNHCYFFLLKSGDQVSKCLFLPTSSVSAIVRMADCSTSF